MSFGSGTLLYQELKDPTQTAPGLSPSVGISFLVLGSLTTLVCVSSMYIMCHLVNPLLYLSPEERGQVASTAA